jgi:ankyrin repeat protein
MNNEKISISYFIVDNNDEIIDPIYTQHIVDMIISEDAHMEIMKEYIEPSANASILADAFKLLKQKEFSRFRNLVTKNKNIINTKYTGTFLIHESCQRGLPECAALLLFLGAECSIFNDKGMTAQHCAVLSGSTVLIDILSLFGHSMNVTSVDNKTPFQYAIDSKNHDMMKALMIYKTDLFINPIEKNDDLIDTLDEYIKDP